MTKIQLKRSSALLSGSARVPASNQLDYGELAINYSSTDPQLFYKDSGGNVVSFFEPYAPLSGATFTGDCTFNTDVDFDGAVTIQGDSTNGSGKLTLTCEQNTHAVNIKAPANSASANYTLTLPSSAGSSGEVLSTDGSGGLSWAYAAMSTADKSKLDGIAAGAEVNVNADWNATSGDAEILNKPTNVSTFTNDAGYITGTYANFLRSDASDTATGTIVFDQCDVDIRGNIGQNSTTALSSMQGRLVFDADYSDTARGPNKVQTYNDGNNFVCGLGIHNNTASYYSGGVHKWYKSNSQTSFTELMALDAVGNLSVLGATVWTSGNDGVSSGLDADLLDGYHQTSFLRIAANSSSPTNGTFAIGSASSRNFIQSHAGQPLDLNPLGNAVTINGTSNTVWHAGNDGAGSGLDADNLDGYTWSSAGKNVRGSQVYADDWFRNNVQGQGLYNQVTATHFYSASSTYWHINSSNGLVCYTAYNGTSGNASNRKGYLYWSNDGFGLLSSAGTWCVNIPPSGSSSNALIVGGHASNNHYNSVSSSRMSFGGGNDFSNYHLGTNTENYGGSYTKLDLRWHTGIRMGARRDYGGIRFYDNEDLGSLQWHFNGSSGYTYKYNWLNTTTDGIYSSTNSAHIMPNTTSTYAAWRISGSRTGYAGLMILDDQGYHNALMWNDGNGGWYQQNGSGWSLYWHRGNSCMGIAGSSTSSSYDLYVTGAIYATGNITAYSDGRKKTNIKTIESALSKVLNLRGVTYNKINVDKTVSEKDEMGVIAQEVEKIVPEVVTYAEDVDEYGVSYGNLTALLIEAIKELKIELTELKESLA